MESLGAYLKKERESKGVTLEEIANSTHISKKFLKAIELDDFAALPNQTVARGFLRAYTRCICIDSTEVINAYAENIKGLEQNKTHINTIFLKEKSKFKSAIAAGSILTAIFFSIYLGTTNNQVEKKAKISTGTAKEIKITPHEDTSEKLKNRSAEKLPEETALIDQKSVQPDAVITKAEQKVEDAKPEVSSNVSDDELFLTIEAKEEAWLNVLIDNVETKDVILHPGEKIKWKATKSFLFSSGNKKGLDVFLQGILVNFPEPQNLIIKNFMIDRLLLKKEIPPQAQ